MPAKVLTERFAGPLAERLLKDPPANEIRLHWLGQAGFVVSAGRRRFVIDPYLSDSLAEKYRGTVYPHERMAPPPVTVSELGALDLALLTHHHTDHMDPQTLRPLAAEQPGLRFVVPEASRDEALRRIGVPAERLIGMDAGRSIRLFPDMSLTGLRAAHEELETDAEGHYRFLGYALRFEGFGREPIVIVHSGDTVPFPGQEEDLAQCKPDLLLFPVNGRSAALRAGRVPGNLTLEEAVALAGRAGGAAVVAHHYGMFAFNTRPLADIERLAASPDLPVRLIPAHTGVEIRLSAA